MRTLLLAWLLITGFLPAFAQDLVITNVTLLTGTEPQARLGAQIHIKGRLIERIGKAGDAIPTGATVIDGQGYCLMPGLIDCHTHLDNMAAARRALHSGVTTVRTAGVNAFQDVALDALVESGRIAGPDIVAAGVYVTPEPGETILADPRLGHLIAGIQSDDELRSIVNVNIDRGAKVIKTRGTERAGMPDTDPRKQVYSEHQLRVIVSEAAKRNIPVMVHAHGDEGARAAVLAGARSIEHGTFLSEGTLRLMKEKGTWLVPTYVTLEDLTRPGGDYEHAILEIRGQHMLPVAARMVRKAHELGVRIATGADNGYTSQSTSRIAQECQHLVQLGMTPLQAIQCATRSAAELLNEPGTGTIAPGQEADLILVPGNPLEDIRHLQDVLMVVSNGQVAMKRIPFGIGR